MKKLILVLTACLTSAILADTIHLKSGSVLKGKVVSITEKVVVFEPEDFDEVTIKVENIAELDCLGERPVKFNDDTVVTKKLTIVDGKYLADEVPLNSEKVKAIDPKPEQWHGDIHAAYNGARGNSYEDTGSVTASLTRRWEHDRVKLAGGYYFSRTGSGSGSRTTSTDRWEIEGQEDHFWSTSFYSLVNLRAERDRIAQLNARYRVGLGGGYQWLEKYDHEATGVWDFSQEFGVNWVKEDYEDNDDVKKDGFGALRYAHNLKYVPKWNDGIEVFHNFEILPEVDDWEKYLVTTDIGITTKIIGNIDLIAKIEWDFNSKPANDRKKADTRYIVGLGYKW